MSSDAVGRFACFGGTCEVRVAFTGVVQATALEAEAPREALLAGPDQPTAWLPHGGVVVLDDGGVISR